MIDQKLEKSEISSQVGIAGRKLKRKEIGI